MSTLSRLTIAIGAAVGVAAAGCTSILGGVDFDGSGGASSSTSTVSTSTTSTSTSSSSSSSSTSTSSTSGTGGSGGSGGSGGAGPCQPDSCSGNGTCDGSTGTAVCTCTAGWIGSSCDTCVFFVDFTATGAGDGASWSDAFTSIQPALEAGEALVTAGAPSCDVWVKEGTYYVYATSQGDTINLRAGVGLYGGFNGTETARTDADPAMYKTILDGHGSQTSLSTVHHVVTAADVATATIDGFTIQGGDAAGTSNDASGGGILFTCSSTPGSLSVSRCEIADNACTEFGGGIGMIDFCNGLTIAVTDCFIHDNVSGDHAGGMFCGSPCTVTGTTFQGNSADVGGGLSQGGAMMTVTDTSFVDNVSTSDGGGLYILSFPAGATLSDLIFSGNVAGGIGGGLSGNAAVSVTVTNGLFVGNTASAGGAIADDSQQGFVCNDCTITGNLAPTGGNGIDWISSNDVAAPRLFNTIVWGNPSMVTPSGDDIYPVNWTAVGASHSDVSSYGGTDSTTFDQDPLFTSVPSFFDRTSSAASVTSGVVVASTTAYTVGDLLEIGADGTGRTVSAIDATSGTVSFSPSLSTPAARGTQIRDWGAVTTLPTLDLHLSADSPCIGAGTSSFSPVDNLDGDPNPNPPDVGAY